MEKHDSFGENGSEDSSAGTSGETGPDSSSSTENGSAQVPEADTVECYTCKRNLQRDSFSRKQLSKWREFPLCRDCMARPDVHAHVQAVRRKAQERRWAEQTRQLKEELRQLTARRSSSMDPTAFDPDLAGPIADVVAASDASATRSLHKALDAIGPLGVVAHHLLAAQRNSDRAKRYRSFSMRYYAVKGKELTCLTDALQRSDLRWGWGKDDAGGWVIYVEIPTGQVSFHALERGNGPEYPGVWDGAISASALRIIGWCRQLLPNWKYERPLKSLAELRKRRRQARERSHVLITGRTYAVHETLKSLGGRWDRHCNGWWVPKENEAAARDAVQRGGTGTPGGYAASDEPRCRP